MDSLRIRDITSTDCGQILKLIKELAGDKEVKVSKSGKHNICKIDSKYKSVIKVKKCDTVFDKQIWIS